MNKPYEVTSECSRELLRERKPKYLPRGRMASFEDIPQKAPSEKPSEEWADLAKDTNTDMGQAIRDRLRKLTQKPF